MFASLGCVPCSRWPPASRPVAAAGLRLAADNGDSVSDLRETHGPRHPALGGSLEEEQCLLLGDPWDDELEPFRHAAAGAPVRWRHATGCPAARPVPRDSR